MTKARPVDAIAILALFATASMLNCAVGRSNLEARKQVGTKKSKGMCAVRDARGQLVRIGRCTFSGMCDNAKGC